MSVNAPVRIIAGTKKGARLVTPKTGTHPMGARERNALFNMLDVDNKTVLDLFAGSGALGLEALSRGATKVAFVELSADAAKIIKTNLEALGFKGCASVIRSSVLKFTSTERFDLVFVDPPYPKTEFFTPTSIKGYAKFVKKGGYLIISAPKGLLLETPPHLQMIKQKSYAGATIAIFANL